MFHLSFRPWRAFCFIATMCVTVASFSSTGFGQDASDVQQGGVEVLTRGPLHEAFAEPYQGNPQPGLVVSAKPPEPIDEIPPEYKPEGDNVQWIPGYWAWDEDLNNFIWISGLWRDIPPNQQWVPGYWEQIAEGYRWVPGFWTSAESEELQYLPYPPESLEQGPSSPEPSAEYFWVPGMWMFIDGNFRWRAGYWALAYDDWAWVPARYIWTPRGCIYRTGFWDYPPPRRAVVFAPVFFRSGYYPGYQYRPNCVINSGVGLFVHLFVRPSYHHYYFGDYYGDRYAQRQFYAWCGGPSHRRADYDPLYAYYRATPRGRTVNVINQVTIQHNYFVKNENVRPPRTWNDQDKFVQRVNQNNVDIDRTQINLAVLGNRLSDVADRHDGNVTFRRLDAQDLDAIKQRVQPIHALERQRIQVEATGRAQADDNARAADRGSLKLPGVPADVQRRVNAALGGRDVGTDANRTGNNQGQTRRTVPGESSNQRPNSVIPNRDQPDSGRPDFGIPDTGRPNVGRPRIDQPGIVRPKFETPDAGRPENSSRSADEKPDVFNPNSRRPNFGKPDSVPPSTGKPDGGGPFSTKPVIPQPIPQPRDVVPKNVGPQSRVPNTGERPEFTPRLNRSGPKIDRPVDQPADFGRPAPSRVPGPRSFDGQPGNGTDNRIQPRFVPNTKSEIPQRKPESPARIQRFESPPQFAPRVERPAAQSRQPAAKPQGLSPQVNRGNGRKKD